MDEGLRLVMVSVQPVAVLGVVDSGRAEIAAEDYEKAALYRDYLKVLNHGSDTKDGQQ